MKKSSMLLMLAAAMIGCGAFAEEPGQPPEEGPRGPGMREGRRHHHPNISKILQLNDKEKAAVKTSNETFKATVKPIREKALAEAKKAATAAFDAKITVYKAAAARLTDEKAKERAKKMLTDMEENRDRMIEMMANRALMPERPMMRGPHGQRGPQQDGDRPMPPPDRR